MLIVRYLIVIIFLPSTPLSLRASAGFPVLGVSYQPQHAFDLAVSVGLSRGAGMLIRDGRGGWRRTYSFAKEWENRGLALAVAFSGGCIL